MVSAALGQRSVPRLEFVASKRPLVTSARAREEVGGRARHLGGRSAEALRSTAIALAVVTVVDHSVCAALTARAAEVLRLAAASANGSTADAHALARSFDGDIWSHDRDFAGTGWPSWSSANLRDALADA